MKAEEIQRQIKEALFGYTISTLMTECCLDVLEVIVVSDNFSEHLMADRIILVMDRIHDHCPEIYGKYVIIAHPLTNLEYKRQFSSHTPLF